MKTKVILIKTVLLKRKTFIVRILRESQRASGGCGSWKKLRGFVNLKEEKMTFILLTSNRNLAFPSIMNKDNRLKTILAAAIPMNL